jgi:hypothetical protein
MEDATVKEIQDMTKQLGELLVTIEPATPADWEAMEKMQAAHKQLRSIDIAELIERPPRAGFTK